MLLWALHLDNWALLGGAPVAGVCGWHCCGEAGTAGVPSWSDGTLQWGSSQPMLPELTVLESAANGVEMLARLEALAASDRALLQGSSQHLAMCPPFSEERLCCAQSECG